MLVRVVVLDIVVLEARLSHSQSHILLPFLRSLMLKSKVFRKTPDLKTSLGNVGIITPYQCYFLVASYFILINKSLDC